MILFIFNYVVANINIIVLMGWIVSLLG